MNYENLRCLVLNKNYMPVNLMPLETIPVKDAITRVFNGTCHVASEYDLYIRTANKDTKIKWPSVIVRNDAKLAKPRVAMTEDNLYYRDHGICQYCEKKLELREVSYDHVVPKSAGGLLTWENTVIACHSCNNLKDNNMPIGEFKPKQMPYKPTYNQLVNIRRKFPITVDSPDWIPYIELGREWPGGIKIRDLSKFN